MVRPSALAVLWLMTRSNFVGCSMGRSAGLAPLRILSTYAPTSEERATVDHGVRPQAFCGCGLYGEWGKQIGSMQRPSLQAGRSLAEAAAPRSPE